MKRRHVRLVIQRDGPVRREQFMGREHVVMPAVLVQEQVLSNNLGDLFLPLEEIAASVDRWNNIPVVQHHPMKKGHPVSARTPEVLNERGVGSIQRARLDGIALKADLYLDTARLSALPDTATMVANVEAGEPGELSTGFATAVEVKEGEHEGKAYKVVAHDLQPDHLALLPGGKGACSVEDGCGLGVNCAADCGCQEPGIMEKFIATMAAAGRKLRTVLVPAENQSDEDRRQRLSMALRGKFGGPGKDVWLDSVFSDEAFVVYEVMSPVPEVNGLFRAKYTMDAAGKVTFEDPETVRRVTVFEPVANSASGNSTSTQERVMNREQLIAHLARTGPLTAVELAKLSDGQLTALNAAAAPAPANNDNPVTLAETRRLLREKQAELDALNARTATALDAEEKRRVGLVEDLCYNGETAFTNAQIEAMDIATLQQLHDTVFKARGVTNVGRGGPRAATGGPTFDFVRDVMDGPAGRSALDPAPNAARH